jgi:hypothetical protein
MSYSIAFDSVIAFRSTHAPTIDVLERRFRFCPNELVTDATHSSVAFVHLFAPSFVFRKATRSLSADFASVSEYSHRQRLLLFRRDC